MSGAEFVPVDSLHAGDLIESRDRWFRVRRTHTVGGVTALHLVDESTGEYRHASGGRSTLVHRVVRRRTGDDMTVPRARRT